MRKTHDAALKAKVALEAMKGDKTIAQLSGQFAVHPNQISKWKKELMERLPEIFNSDQGSQFTSFDFTGRLQKEGVQISMDGRGRAYDNIYVERLWRTVKYEEVYLHDYQSVREAREQLGNYFRFYNEERIHSSLGCRPPAEVYFGQRNNCQVNFATQFVNRCAALVFSFCRVHYTSFRVVICRAFKRFVISWGTSGSFCPSFFRFSIFTSTARLWDILERNS